MSFKSNKTTQFFGFMETRWWTEFILYKKNQILIVKNEKQVEFKLQLCAKALFGVMIREVQ